MQNSGATASIQAIPFTLSNRVRLIMPAIEVNMGDRRFTSDDNTTLNAYGVSTSIAFIVQGAFWDDDDDEINYCGLYYWQGFDLSSTPQAQQAVNALTRFLQGLRDFAGLDATSDITINTLTFIGGEKEQKDAEDNILVSGTEAEVNALRTAVAEFDYTATHFTLAAGAISHQHFQTTNNESISIELSTNECSLQIEEYEFEELQEEIEQEATPMLLI